MKRNFASSIVGVALLAWPGSAYCTPLIDTLRHTRDGFPILFGNGNLLIEIMHHSREALVGLLRIG